MTLAAPVLADLQADTTTKRFMRRPSRAERCVYFVNVYQNNDGQQLRDCYLPDRERADLAAYRRDGFRRVYLFRVTLKSAVALTDMPASSIGAGTFSERNACRGAGA